MALEMMQLIMAEEETANQLLREAQQSANEMVKNAETTAALQERQAAVDQRANYQQLLDQRREKVEALLLAQSTQRQEQAGQLSKQAAQHLPQAVDFIVKEVLHGHR